MRVASERAREMVTRIHERVVGGLQEEACRLAAMHYTLGHSSSNHRSSQDVLALLFAPLHSPALVTRASMRPSPSW